MDKLLLGRSERTALLSLSRRSVDCLVVIGQLASKKLGERRLSLLLGIAAVMIPGDAVERLEASEK